MLIKGVLLSLFTGKDIVPDSDALSSDYLVVKGNELHRIITLLVMGFVVVYSALGFIQGYWLPSIIILCLLPFTILSYLVFGAGYTLLSKLINLVSVSACITLVTGCYGPTSFVQAFFIPVLASTLIVFQGKERKLGLLLAAPVFVLFIVVTGIEFHIGNLALTEEQLKTERTMNLIGSSAVTLMEVLVVLTLSNKIQEALLEQTRSLNATIATRDKMMTILTHDLRSPLALISSTLHTITPELSKQSTEHFMLHELSKRADATLVMVDNLLLWSRAQTNQIAYMPEEVYLNEIRRMMQGFIQLHHTKEVHMHYDMPENGAVLADRNLLQIILRNLYSNAVKFSFDEGTITFTVNAKETSTEFVLSDTGAGMDKEKINQIRSGKAWTTPGTHNQAGNGIGLQVVQEFLQMHHTELSIYSLPGKGTSFSFTLPTIHNK